MKTEEVSEGKLYVNDPVALWTEIVPDLIHSSSHYIRGTLSNIYTELVDLQNWG